MFELILFTVLLTVLCFAAKAFLAKQEFKNATSLTHHPDSYYPPVSRDQRN
jgi:hypothetical protein